MEKMTNVKALQFVVDNFKGEMPEDVAAKIEAIKASFENKAANRKPTKTQEENEGIKDAILAVLTADGATVTEIQGRSETLAALSNQRVSALLRQLVDAGKVVKSTDKKKALFALAE